MTGYNSSLLIGFATLLDAEGIGTYLDAGVYPADVVGVFIGITADKPDKAITLMTYPVDDSDLTTVTTGLQIKFRAGRDPNEIEDMSDAVYDLLHNKQHYQVGGIRINLSWRQSGSWIGQDSNQRIERSENFYLLAERVATHQIP